MKQRAKIKMKIIHKLIFCASLIILSAISAHAGQVTSIIIYYAAHNNYQELLVSTINSNLNNIVPDGSIRFITDSDMTIIKPDDLIISIGDHKKLNKKLETLNNDVIYINDTTEYHEKNNAHYVDIKITQPPCRQLRLISSINKRWKRIGYLTSKPNDNRLALLKKCSAGLGLVIKSVQVRHDDIPAAIDRVLPQCDVLLALPNYSIYNSRSVKNILLSAYQLRIPVIGFSRNFVNAGALAAAYSTPEEISQQLTAIILYRQKQNKLPDARVVYPKYFSVSTNTQVANALNLSLPAAKTIKNSIERMEQRQ